MAFLQGERDAPPASKRQKVKGKVIVVGAGPAGLAAALHLQVTLISGIFLSSGHPQYAGASDNLYHKDFERSSLL